MKNNLKYAILEYYREEVIKIISQTLAEKMIDDINFAYDPSKVSAALLSGKPLEPICFAFDRNLNLMSASELVELFEEQIESDIQDLFPEPKSEVDHSDHPFSTGTTRVVVRILDFGGEILVEEISYWK
jgi:hypothetical protein